MRIFFLTILVSFQVLACPANEIYSQKKLDPNFEILAFLRDSGVNVDKALNQLSIGKSSLGPMTLVNWRVDYSAAEQLMLFNKYLRRSILKKQNDFKAIDFQDPHSSSLEYFDDQIKAYHKALYTNRRSRGVSINAVFDDVMLGETIYFVKDMSNIDNFIKIKFYNESKTPLDDLDILVHDIPSGALTKAGPDDGEVELIFEQVKSEYWNDFAFQLWKLQIISVE